VILIALALVAAFALAAYPLYPSRLDLCQIVESRDSNKERWATPHRGAIFIARGILHDGPEDMRLFEHRTDQCHILIAVRVPRGVLASPETRRALQTLRTDKLRTEDRTLPVHILARVDSEVLSCFGPGMIATAFAVTGDGSPRYQNVERSIRP